MILNKVTNRLKWGIIGGFLGGLIAIIGFEILKPSLSISWDFVIPRIIIGSIVAVIIGPIAETRLIKSKTE